MERQEFLYLVYAKDPEAAAKETVERINCTVRLNDIFGQFQKARIQYYFLEQNRFHKNDGVHRPERSPNKLKHMRF
jgi:hypothetical protein